MTDAVYVPGGRDESVPAHYGSPLVEQRALRDGNAVVDTSHRGVVTVGGADRLGWLHSLTTQALEALPAGVSTEAFILTPQGRIEHHLRVVDDGATTWLTCEPRTVSDLVAWLQSMQFTKDVQVADVTEQWAVLHEPVTAEHSLPAHRVWASRWPQLPGTSMTYNPAPEHPGEEYAWRELIVPRDQVATWRTDGLPQGVAWSGMWAAEALRVAGWQPRHLADTDDRSIPHELDWLRTTVHLAKGCYRGQETVARVRNLGKPPRKLVFCHLDGSDHELPETGSDVTVGEKTVGKLTSVARHFELGPIGLAVVKRSADTTGAVTVGGIAAAVTDLVVA